jgi:hypothetical protein
MLKLSWAENCATPRPASILKSLKRVVVLSMFYEGKFKTQAAHGQIYLVYALGGLWPVSNTLGPAICARLQNGQQATICTEDWLQSL